MAETIIDDRRQAKEKKSLFPRISSWNEFFLFLGQAAGLVTITGTALIFIATKVFGLGVSTNTDKIAQIVAKNTEQDSAIAANALSQEPMFYMTCVMFSEKYTNKVPKACDKVLSTRP